jgi:hypothetical protein
MAADSIRHQAEDSRVAAGVATESAEHGQQVSDHGHAGDPTEPLGPVDVAAWTYAIGGAVIGLLVVVVLYLASS